MSQHSGHNFRGPVAVVGMFALLLVGVAHIAAAESVGGSPTGEQDKGAAADAEGVQERAVPRRPFQRPDIKPKTRPSTVKPPSTPLTPVQPLIALAAPPPIGPPEPVAPVQELPIHLMITNLKDGAGNNIGVRGQVDRAIAAVNANAAQQSSVRAKILVESFTVYGPSMSNTTYTDRPNHRFVRIPYIVGYKVYDVKKRVGGSWVSTGITRHLSQSIGIHVFCDRWETGSGSLKIVTAIDRPYMEPNQGTIEQVVDFFLNGHLTDFIDGQVRQQINSIAIANGSTNLPLECNALSRDAGALDNPNDDIVRYSNHRPRVTVVTDATALNQISVKLLSLKRLVAHDLRGAVLYKPSEAPALEFYANSQHFHQPLQPLQEGQQVALNAPPFVMKRPGDGGTLILVANIIQNVATGTEPTDSAFLAFDSKAGFGHGTRTLRIPKFYTIPADPRTGAKPSRVPVDAYELTLQITAQAEFTTDPGTGTTPTPGTVKPGILVPALKGRILKRGIEEESAEQSTAEPQTETGSKDEAVPAPAQP